MRTSVSVDRERGLPQGPTTPETRVARFIEGLGTSRALTVSLDRATERRLWRSLRDFCGADEGLSAAQELEVALLAAADGGLRDAEARDGVWSDVDGTCWPLPRERRVAWRMRLRFAWDAARVVWHAH